jgi:hypothetical protein
MRVVVAWRFSSRAQQSRGLRKVDTIQKQRKVRGETQDVDARYFISEQERPFQALEVI